MNRNSADKTIAEKINGLDPLQVGLVSGREDAWEKLQGRMDAKPNRRLPVWYWPAAALLLLMAGAGISWYVNSRADRILREVVSGETQALPEIATDTMPAESIVVNTTVDDARNTEVKTMSHIPTAKYSIPDSLIEPPPPPHIYVVRDLPSPPYVAPRSAMKVVHINELDNQEDFTRDNVVAATSTVSIADMDVVHVNEISKNSWQRWSTLPYNHISIVRILPKRNDLSQSEPSPGIFCIRVTQN